jgi:hypothetical protein
VLTLPALRRQVAEGERRVMDALRATDFRALLLERLAPVLEGRSPAPALHP